ncbi:hypothetical protein ACT20J_001713 [Campylobacter upsaliensis]
MNKKFFSNLTILTILCAFSIGLFTPSTKANASTTTTAIYESTQSTVSSNPETRGIKKWIAKTALKTISKALRNGGSIIKKVTKELGGKEARYFAKNLDVIANALDSLNYATDFVEDAVIDTISSALISAGVPSGVARTIANVFTFIVF